MLECIEDILKSFIAKAPENVIPLLMLDSYQCHMMASVISLIQHLAWKLNISLMYVTSLWQPFDVGINKSMKANICKDWEDWMLGSGISVSITKPPTRKLIVEWVMKTYNSISVEVAVNF